MYVCVHRHTRACWLAGCGGKGSPTTKARGAIPLGLIEKRGLRGDPRAPVYPGTFQRGGGGVLRFSQHNAAPKCSPKNSLSLSL